MLFPVILSSFTLGVSAATIDLTLTNGPTALDGFTRAGILANGQPFGPLITYNKDDTFSVNVVNDLTDNNMRRSTSIHWHGLFQHRTAANDGPAFVTQCPIAPQTSFLYEFPLNNQPGTFWYHSHLSTQYCDGLRGVLVVYDPDDPYKDMYDVDDESTIITLAEFYHNLAPAAQKAYFQTNVVPNPNATLINNVGRYPGGPAVPWAIVNVEQGKRYRLRVVNIACRPPYSFSIQGHNITIIEADGQWTDPLEVPSFDIFPAQRYSAILNANQPVANYWIFGVPTTSTANLNPTDGRAILRYLGAPSADPAPANQTITVSFLESNVHNAAFNSPGLGGDIPADETLVLNIVPTPNTPFFRINNVSFVPPTVPTLLQILNGAANPTDFLPTEQVFVLERDKLYEVQIPGAGGHPFHLHGHAFDVVQSGNTANQPAVRNYVNPVRRDVVAVTGNLTTFRFRTDNPGPWFLHCHIDWHLEAGLAVIFGEAPSDNVSGPDSQIHSQQWDNLCPTYDALPPNEQ